MTKTTIHILIPKQAYQDLQWYLDRTLNGEPVFEEDLRNMKRFLKSNFKTIEVEPSISSLAPLNS